MEKIRNGWQFPGRRRTLDVAGRFSVLRTRLIQEMSRQGWRRLGVCPVTSGAGATYVTANLGLASARLPNFNVLLVDLALRDPRLASQLGLTGDKRAIDYLRGADIRPEDFIQVIDRDGRMYCCLPDAPLDSGAELLQNDGARARIDGLIEMSECDLAIFDLSPVLGTDEGLAIMPTMDAVLLVVDGRHGTGQQIADTQRLLADMPPLLGVVLNKAELLG